MTDLTDQQVNLVIASQRQEFWTELSAALKSYYPYNLIRFEKIDDLLSPPEGMEPPLLIIIDGSCANQELLEWVQSARMSFEHTKILTIFGNSHPLKFAELKKNGTDKLIQLPFDEEILTDTILQMAPVDLQGDHIPLSALLPLLANDLEPNTKINFDLYLFLPANNRVLRLRKPGGVVDERVLNKINESSGQKCYVKKTQLTQFFEYQADVMMQKGDMSLQSPTELRFKIKTKVPELLEYFLDADTKQIEDGRNLLKKCEEMIQDLGLHKKIAATKLISMLVSYCGEPDSIYNQVLNVTVFSALFAHIQNKPENEILDAAFCGLLHNIGLSILDPGLVRKCPQSMSEQELAEYYTYPTKSVHLIRSQKVPLNQNLAKAIEHQRADYLIRSGTDLVLEKLDWLTKNLNIAIVFNEMTCLREGKRTYVPKEAIATLFQLGLESSLGLDIQIIKSLKMAFDQPAH